MRFVDTNVLLYSVSTKVAEEAKVRKSEALLAAGDWAVSVQVLQEFYTQATRPTLEGAMSHQQAAAFVRKCCDYPVQELTLELLHAALATKERYRISYWDAAIIEAARELGCAIVLTEDLNHGQDYDGVSVVNPFREV